MPAPLADLLAELQTLGLAERRRIIGRLDAPDQERVTRLLGRAKVSPPPSFDALAGLSPWLSESLTAARSGPATPGAPALTEATCDALLDAERLLPKAGIAVARPASLLQRLGRRGARR